mmetsp:Transcript_21153/g.42446  ORF Transcript_21153/g.42446 Transcript_21153/m.42446 type:complete len:618 (-) Transcript_21153:933-2786(-)
MVTALIFGKPAARTSVSAKEKEKDDGKSREKERERSTVVATAKPSTSSNNNSDRQKLAAYSQRQNNHSNSAANGAQYGASSATSNTLPLTKNNMYTAATRPGQKVQNGESVPLMSKHSASWRPLTHDKAKGSINSNGGKSSENRISAAPAAAPKEGKMSKEEKWIKTFNALKEYQKHHGSLPTAEWDNGKTVEELDLTTWMVQQSSQYQKHLGGKKSTLSSTCIELLRSIGMCDEPVRKGKSKRRCMFWGCKRALGAYESFHCAEHKNVYTSTPPHPFTNTSTSTSAYSTSKPAVKRQKKKAGESSSKSSTKPSANGTKHRLKSRPEETLKKISPPKETSRIEEDDIVKVVKLAADAVAKEIRYLGLKSPTDHAESAIKRFAVEVYCPLLYSSKARSMGTSSFSSDRVLLSTLLALQEMLVINADKFFSFAGLKDSSTEKKESGEEADSKLTRDFARAVVQNAAKRLQRMTSDVSLKQIIPNQDCLFDQYLEASRSYDTKGEDFQLALGRLDASSTYRNAKGSKLSARESIMARTSFNYARKQHRLIREDDASGGRTEAHPAPNACAIFVMGESESVGKESVRKEEQTSVNVEARHHKRTEVRESRIRLLKRYYDDL